MGNFSGLEVQQPADTAIFSEHHNELNSILTADNNESGRTRGSDLENSNAELEEKKVLPKFELKDIKDDAEKKPIVKDNDTTLDIAENLSENNLTADSTTGRLLVKAISEASGRGQFAIDALVAPINKALAEHGRQLEVTPGPDGMMPPRLFNIQLTDTTSNIVLGDILQAEGQGRK